MITHPRNWLPEGIVDLYDHFLFEWRSFAGRLFGKKQREYTGLEYVNFGCGTAEEGRFPGFLNADFFSNKKGAELLLDLRFPVPLKDDAWKGIFAHHVLEHLQYKEARRFLGECHRILKEGAVLRVVVPDAETIMRLYCGEDPEARKSLLTLFPNAGPFETPIEAANYIFYGGKFNAHLFSWDYETLRHSLKGAGFKEIVKSSAGKSLDPALARDNMGWSKFSLYVDAVK